MIKLYIGGSPCTYWSIAQKNNRETTAEGLGWELFKNYLIGKEKFNPDFFLYENNKSAAQPIKDQIKTELKVDGGGGARYIEINSALVSAQNRQRFYVHNFGNVEQPEDRKIMLNDILECGVIDKEKSYCLKHQAGNSRDYFKKHHTQICCETVGIGYRNRRESDGKLYRRFETHGEEKSNALTTVPTDSMVSVKIGSLPRPNGELSSSQAMRIYDIKGKSVNLSAGGGGLGGKTGLYAIPCGQRQTDKARTITAGYSTTSQRDFRMDIETGGFIGKQGVIESCDSHFATPIEFNENREPIKATSGVDGKVYTVYKVRDSMISIKDKLYPIKLPDGYYIIRKLTVVECCRLQTLPDDYCRAVSDSQTYKGLGNGWTAEVIIHIMQNKLKDIPKDEKLLVLSMYDGIGTGRYCLDKMGFNNVEYHAYEIDKYAMAIAKSNYSDIIYHGDAFDIRKEGWKL